MARPRLPPKYMKGSKVVLFSESVVVIQSLLVNDGPDKAMARRLIGTEVITAVMMSSDLPFWVDDNGLLVSMEPKIDLVVASAELVLRLSHDVALAETLLMVVLSKTVFLVVESVRTVSILLLVSLQEPGTESRDIEGLQMNGREQPSVENADADLQFAKVADVFQFRFQYDEDFWT